MVRKSILVYDLLRTEQPKQGFTEKEIVQQISNKLDISAGKALKKQVTVALRRGLDFGILTKNNNKFRFDPDAAKTNTLKRKVPLRQTARKKRKEVKKTVKSRKRSNVRANKNRKINRPMPQPKLPKSWVPSKRNLIDEPLSKVKKI
ncbi:hypothetical protein ANTQUA_LOCUS10061 [Anthophora quadrimaculata]